MSSLLSCRSISKAYGAQRLFSDLDLVIKDGDRVLVGKYSGSDIKLGSDEYVILREDEILAMAEVVSRYFSRRMKEEKPLPDLVVIDGGMLIMRRRSDNF